MSGWKVGRYEWAPVVVDCRFCGLPIEGEAAAEAEELRAKHERGCIGNPERERSVIIVL